MLFSAADVLLLIEAVEDNIDELTRGDVACFRKRYMFQLLFNFACAYINEKYINFLQITVYKSDFIHTILKLLINYYCMQTRIRVSTYRSRIVVFNTAIGTVVTPDVCIRQSMAMCVYYSASVYVMITK